ncbi:MAG TPA: Nif3-like dinuclear metal center hexameric protein, partial [Candidatus Brocadiia bacterium]|nr:Nif3-like dinuclear metal center hexameric protein [Candidatus Brocadiia bacterium]
MTHARDILLPIEERLGVPYMMWPDGGFFSGGPDDEVRGVMVTWMATASALQAAADHGCNLVLTHEPPLFSEKNEAPPYRWTTPVFPAAETERSPNRQRRELIQRHKLTILQVHYGLDRYCIGDVFAKACGLDRVAAGDGYEKVYELDAPISVHDL